MDRTPTITNTQALPGGITVTTATSTVDITLIPFIRARKIYFKMQGLLPNMRHRPYFDGVDVSNWCREETYYDSGVVEDAYDPDLAKSLSGHPQSSSNLISDSNGNIEGSFFIPNTNSISFRSGRKEFKVLDWTATNDNNAISKAFATYTAQGYLENRLTTVTTVFPPPSTPPVRYIDPVAQSFICEKEEGYFVTSVDIFFKTKSSTVPVRVQIRPVISGVPTNYIIPGAEVWKNAASVNVSASPNPNNSSTYTTFTFDTPIYLEGFTEYAIVVIAESDQYEVWTAATTEFEVGSTTKRIMKQPSMGSFFKSQNGSTWTPDQSRDLTFRIKTARFSVSTPGTAYFENVELPSRRLGSNPLNVLTAGVNPSVVVTHQNHGFAVGSKAVLSGCVATRGLTTGQLNTTHDVTSVPDHDHYVIQVTGTSTSTGTGGGTVVQSQQDNKFSVIYPTINQLLTAPTNIAWTHKTTSGKSVAGIESPYIKQSSFVPLIPNRTSVFDTVRTVASPANETNALGGAKSFIAKAVLSTNSTYVSPIIDLSRLSISLISNRIDRQAAAPETKFNVPSSYIAETNATLGTSVSKHVAIPMTLQEAAIGLKVIFAANRPSDSFIELYYKTIPVGSEQTLETTAWTLATIDDAVPTDDNLSILREYRYTIDNLEPFNTYQFKLVFKSSNEANVPSVKDFRAIALAT